MSWESIAISYRRLNEQARGIILDERRCGGVLGQSRQRRLAAIARGRASGGDSVILGSTKIGLLIGSDNIDLPVSDSTLPHTGAAVAFSPADQDPPLQAA